MITQVFTEDCMNVMSRYADKHFDLAIVDPPYGLNATKMNMGTHTTRSGDGYPGTTTAVRLRHKRLSGGGTLADRAIATLPMDWDNAIPGPEYFAELFRVSKHQIIWGGNYFPLHPSRCWICWDKKQPWDNFSQFELAWTSFDKPAKMFRFSNKGGANNEKKINATQKPIELYDFCFREFCEPGWRVIDTHLGSGSSRIVSEKMGIEFVGCEVDPVQVHDHEIRFKRFLKQERLKLQFA